MLYYGIDYTYESLSHHGVVGMKWGKRKQRTTAAKRSTRVKRDASFEYDVNKQVEAELRRQRKKAMRKKVAYGLAGAAVAAGIGYAIHKNKQKKLNIPSINSTNLPPLPRGMPPLPRDMPPLPGSKSGSGGLGQKIKDVAKNSTPKKRSNFSAATLNRSFGDANSNFINATNDLINKNKKRR